MEKSSWSLFTFRKGRASKLEVQSQGRYCMYPNARAHCAPRAEQLKIPAPKRPVRSQPGGAAPAPPAGAGPGPARRSRSRPSPPLWAPFGGGGPAVPGAGERSAPVCQSGPRRPRHLGHSSGAALPLPPQDGGGRVSDMPGHVARIAPRPPAPRGLYGSAGHTGGGGEGRAGGRSCGARTAPPLSAASARRALSPPRRSGALAGELGFLLPAGRGDGGSPLGRAGRGSFRGPFAPAGDTARPRATGAGSGRSGSGAPRPIAASPGSGRAGPAGVAGGQGGLAAASPPRTPFLGGLPGPAGRSRAAAVPAGGRGGRLELVGGCLSAVFLRPLLPPPRLLAFLPSLPASPPRPICFRLAELWLFEIKRDLYCTSWGL